MEAAALGRSLFFVCCFLRVLREDVAVLACNDSQGRDVPGEGRKTMKRWALPALALVAAALVSPQEAHSQQYPSRDIHIICGFPAGSGADIYARFFANKLAEISKATVVVENKPGAQGSIATSHVARAKPDGYTIYIGGADAFSASPYLFKTPPIDPIKDFEYISPLLGQGFMLIVDSKRPFKQVSELTAYLKEKKDKASYGTPTNPGTILAELYKSANGLNTVQVNYKTSADFVNDLASGAIDFVMADPVFTLARVKQGVVRPLAISTAKRVSSVPDIPTMQEQGIPDIDLNLWWLMAAPAGTPQPVLDKLHGWLTQVGKDPATREFLGRNGGEPLMADSPAATKTMVAKEVAAWKNYIQVAKIPPQ